MATSAPAPNTMFATGATLSAISTFFARPMSRNARPIDEVSQLRAIDFRDAKLRHHLRVMQDRAGDQVRKVGHEQRVVDRIAFHHLARVHVHQVGNLRECEERNAEGQHHAEQRDIRARQLRGRPQEEIRIFEVRQRGQIDGDGNDQEHARGRLAAVAGPQDPLTEVVVEPDGERPAAPCARCASTRRR